MRIVSKKHLYFFLLIVALSSLLTGCFKKKSTPKPPPPQVTTTEVKQEEVPIFIDAIGQVIPPVTVNIRPQVNGKLIKTYIQQGDIVLEGNVIYEIDPSPYQAVLDEAIAQLKHDQALLSYAEETVLRYKKVVEDDYISILNYDQFVTNEVAAREQVELDKAAVRAAEINLNWCKIVAPVSGKISFFNVDVGNILVIDDPNQITVIRPFSPIDIEFSLPQQQFEMIRQVQGNEGQWKYEAALPENPNHIIKGTTYFIDNQIDQNTGTILLKGRLPNEDRFLWPGEFIKVKVLYKMAPDALIVPPSSVLIGKDGPYIYTVDKEGIAKAINVGVLTRTEQYIALQSDNVHAGDTVIVDGQINVAPGIKVNAVAANQQP